MPKEKAKKVITTLSTYIGIFTSALFIEFVDAIYEGNILPTYEQGVTFIMSYIVTIIYIVIFFFITGLIAKKLKLDLLTTEKFLIELSLITPSCIGCRL